ncbi:MAG: hypothetical protein GF308_17340 [Candidatus Heimdallarchaeota archaeon]|nr:hypothetical protein [Candidatus Heimdallarchaeota archaeon]
MVQKTTNYCEGCRYTWCSNRSQVVLCTMKSKGLFECKSCGTHLSESSILPVSADVKKAKAIITTSS